CEEIIASYHVDKDADVPIVLTSKLDSCIVSTDKERLLQVLHNLVSNAIKFTNEGFIHIGYQLKNDCIEFYVKDTGIGISKKDQQDIFDRFIKINNFIHGTGLGLPICKSIVEKMGGVLWVESELGEGSCFRFTIPNRINDSNTSITNKDINASDNIITNPITTMTIDGANYGNPVVLVAEDADSNYLLVSAILRRQYTIVRARNGVEAIELFKKCNPDLILMDIKMPLMDGLEAVKHIKEINSDVPIVVLTAFAYDNDKQLALEAGCNDYVTKPIDSKKLLELVQKYTQKL
ncbi:MAG: response regulator, partial [Rikenellaceae bacterium]